MIMAIMSSIISLTLIYISFHGVGVAADTQLPQSPITFLPPSPLYYQSDSPLLEEPKGKKNKPPRTRPPRNPPPAPHHPPPPPPVPTFDHFKLSLTWPLTFCKLPGVNCGNQVPLRLTIHGLWPNNKNTELKDCDKEKQIPVDWLKVLRLKEDLVDTWPQLRKHRNVGADLDFWISEWRTHGTCSYPLLNNVEYFEVAMKLYKGIDGENLLRKTNLLGGKSATKGKIVDAIKEQTKFIPQIQCAKIGKQSYLLEVRLCYTATKSPQLKDCNNYRSNCLDEVFF